MPPGAHWLASRWLRGLRRQSMTTFTQLTSASFHPPEPFTEQLRLAVAAYLARFKGSSREHTEPDLRCYLSRCAERGLDPLAAQRSHPELYIRWMQEIRRFKPPTVSRPGVTHLQFEALLAAARESAHSCDFALVAMLGLPGLRIFEAMAADIADLGEEHVTGCRACAAKIARSS
jgi:integrase/recombinase XerD